jgi:uncharacterized membrane protein YkvA (DUF1232 family)
MAKFKVSFELDEDDAAYFRGLYRQAKQSASKLDADQVVKDARTLIARVRQAAHVPAFVTDAITTLEDMTQIILDEEYKAPQAVKQQVLAGLAYFANPQDLIPDHVPALGFLDDAIMVKFVEEEFKHELWGYRKFRGLGSPEEQRPWTKIGGERLHKRREEYRKQIRAEIAERKAKDDAKRTAAEEKRKGAKGGRKGFFGW